MRMLHMIYNQNIKKQEGEMKTITIANRKGGTGKTTTVFNLAHALIEQGHKVCVMDLDSQGHLTKTFALDFIPINNFIEGDITTVANNLDVLSACDDFSSLENIIKKNAFNMAGFIKDNILPKLETKGYDYLLIDTSPTLNIINTNGYACSDVFLIVMLIDYYSMIGLSDMLEIVKQIKSINPNVETRVVINQFRKNRNLNKAILQKLSDLQIFSNIYIPDRQLIKEDILSHRSSISEISEYRQLCEVL